MKNKKLLFVPLSVLAIGAIAGCKGDNISAKLVVAADATLEKVTLLNNEISKVNEGAIPPSNDGEKWEYYDKSQNLKDYCDNQVFGFYIYDNIYYAMKYLYGNNSVNLNTVITGKTKNKVPDLTLGQVLKDKETTLSSLVNSTSSNNKTTVDFKADWDFRTAGLTEADLHEGYSAILTNGRLIYNESSKQTEKLSINYYFTNNNRSFGSFTMDYLNNKFYYLYGSGVNSDTHDLSRWENQAVSTDTIHEYWNAGTFSAKRMRNYSYYFCGAYTGTINTDLSELKKEIKGYDRVNNDGIVGKEDSTSTKGTEYISKWENIVDECYSVNKDLSLRNESDMLDLSKAKQVNIDACPGYAEAKTKTFWIYNDSTYSKSVIPYKEKSELIRKFEELLDGKTEDQKNLINAAKSYVNKIADKDYLCEFDNGDMKFEYLTTEATGQKNYRYNTFKVSSFNYYLYNSAGVEVKF